jgi:hypothetical protein
MASLPTLVILLLFAACLACAAGQKWPLAGADQNTPSRAQYFSWIDNTNEGSTEQQTLANLDFFKWLHDEFGMKLDIYAWDAGNLDSSGECLTMDTHRFRAAYPRGWQPIADRAASFGCRMGLWGGPDGFGDTPAEAAARKNLMIGLCLDCHFALFKVDGVCGTLRPDHVDDFVEMLEGCRKYSPDLILLNHRLDLGRGLAYATTALWEGAETYIDVHMNNQTTGTHHRVGALARGVPSDLNRLLEDHGVCLSSCPDYWDDDLVLQAFNRCMILAPEIYGSPWFLRDDEFPKLARIYNLHRRYRDILVKGMLLPEAQYGPHAVARGDGGTRFLTLRNLTWNPVTYRVRLDESIGLAEAGPVTVQRFHPHERSLGTFQKGDEAPVEVPPFRSCLVMVTARPCPEVAVSGCEAEVVRDVDGRPVVLKLLALPGAEASVIVHPGRLTFTTAHLDGQPAPELAAGKSVSIRFEGSPLARPWHRKLADLKPCPVPADAEALYEATCFAADNDALEARAARRSGPTHIPAVQKAREAFFAQALFASRGCWDRLLFDGDLSTRFIPSSDRWRGNPSASAGPFSLRLDLGAPTDLDRLVIHLAGNRPMRSDAHAPLSHAITPATADGESLDTDRFDGVVECSADLISWQPANVSVSANAVTILPPAGKPVRYFRMGRGSMAPAEVEGFKNGQALSRDGWRASNLFAPYSARPAQAAWTATLTIDEAAPGSYLCIALDGEHGVDGAWAAARLDGRPIGCPDRAVSFDSNLWENDGGGVRHTSRNYTYFLPVTPEMIGRPLDLIVLTLKGGRNDYQPAVWITTQNPMVTHELVLA